MSTPNNPVTWFEIPATDLQRAKEFYDHILGIDLQVQEFGGLKMAWFPAGQNGAGASGSLVQAESYVPSHDGSMVYFSVENIEEALNKIEEKGGRVLNPKMSIGEYGFVGHFEDSEGNRVALHSRE